MNDVTRYAGMKDSGILNFKEIPHGWQITKIKYVAKLDPYCDSSNIADDSDVSFVPMECIKNNKRIEKYSKKSYYNCSYSSFLDGDIAIAKVTPCFENGNVAIMENLTNGYGFGSSELFILRPFKIDTRFLFYFLQSFSFREGAISIMKGTGGLKRVSSTYMKNAFILLPTEDDQKRISNYLDGQCAKIDDIIAGARTSIEEYKKWKASVIYEAVTKGLDPHAEMKDSGVDIIEMIPKYWSIKRQRFLCQTMTGNQDTQDAENEGIYPFYVRSPVVERANSYTFEGESILMAGDGAGAGKVFHHATGKYAIHQRVYCFYDFIDIIPRFYYYFMSNLFSVEIEKGSAKSTVPSVRMPMILNFDFCVPPKEEQRTIIAYLDTKCSEIDQLISEKEALIADLESYKKSLIYEVVTGKRKVI